MKAEDPTARRSISARARTLVALAATSLAAASLVACGSEGDGRAGEPVASAQSSASAAAPLGDVPPAIVNPNPLALPPVTLALDPGKRVFTVSDQMLANAKLGSTLVLQAATVMGFDGDLLVIENRNGPPYKVHPAYAVAVPDDAKIRPGDPVVTERDGVLRHAVVKKHVKDRVTVRFTDGDARVGEMQLKTTRFVRQTDGLAPGNYAAFGDGETLRHVLLVSAFSEGEEKRWLALGAAGSALIVPAHALEPIPVKWQPRAGTHVLAEHNGVLRKATVASTPEPGIFTVKYERAGRPVTLGWGFVMPLAEAKQKAR